MTIIKELRATEKAYKRKLLRDWERYDIWFNCGGNPNAEPTSVLIDHAIVATLRSFKQRGNRRSGRFVATYLLYDGSVIKQPYQISDFGRTVLEPPFGYSHLTKITSRFGATW